MISGLTAERQMDPLLQRKITYVKILGIGCVVGLWALAMAALMGYLPTPIFWPATAAEIALAPFLVRRIRSLRNRRNNASSN
jgi:hypothetical protein